MSEDFDYGAAPIAAAGFKNPDVGNQSARLRSIIHLGTYSDIFREGGKEEVKKPAPHVVMILELTGEDNMTEDGEQQLTIDKDFPLKTGDKATATKIRKAFDSKGEASGFNDFIGGCCMVDVKPGKDKNDDGTPKFVNAGDVTSMPAQFAKMTPALQLAGVGHVTFSNLTKEAILELHPILHVKKILMNSVNYPGSNAEVIVNEMLVENPTWLDSKAKGEQKAEAGNAQQDAPPPEDQDAPAMDSSKEF